VQKFGEEERRIIENIRLKLVYGTRDYLDQIKTRFISQESNSELPQLRQIHKDIDPTDLLQKGTTILGCKIDELRNHTRIPLNRKLDRDSLLHFLRETGWYTNQEIGNLFGLSHSAVSKCATMVKENITKTNVLGHKYEHLKSRIKV